MVGFLQKVWRMVSMTSRAMKVIVWSRKNCTNVKEEYGRKGRQDVFEVNI
jgi:hypothetical protein